jgi:hypothetical protein
MPASRVANAEIELNPSDVVGQDGVRPHFISHVGLAQDGGRQRAAEVPVHDMSPPLHGRGNPVRLNASAVGTASLIADELQKIRTFVDIHASEHAAFSVLSRTDRIRLVPQMYSIFPHAAPAEEMDGRYSRMRFSCSGFVFEAYRWARIQLLDPSTLPPVNMDTIKAAYPDQSQLMERERVSPEDLGLRGAGPWPVLLCGYLFNSLQRTANAIRADVYEVRAGDECFPRHGPQPAPPPSDSTERADTPPRAD